MRKEIIAPVAIALCVLLLSNLGFIFGFIESRTPFVFLGRGAVNSQDTFTYISFIEQAKQGDFYLKNLYAPVQNQPPLIRPAYFILGSIARLANLSSAAAYHLGRLIFSLLFLVALYRFLGFFFKVNIQKNFAFLTVLTTSGLGFLLGNLLPESSDLWIPESNTFLSLHEAPHFILSQFLMLTGFMSFISFLEKRSARSFILSSGSFLLLSFEHPFNLFVIIPTLVLTALISRRLNLQLLLLIGISSLGLFMQAIQVMTDPAMASWYTQNILPSPDPINYLSGLGFLLPFAIFGAESFLTQKDAKRILLMSWIALTTILLYSPFLFQRRFSEGVHIPIAILAATGIFLLAKLCRKYFVRRFQESGARFLTLFVIFILSFSSLASVTKEISAIMADRPESYYYHLLSDEFAAIDWLKKNSKPGDVVFSNLFYGNLIPGLTGRAVYLGHKIQTPGLDDRINLANRFLVNEDDKEAYRYLKESKIAYIFLGKNDAMVRFGFAPDKKPFLTRVFEQGGVTIYKVK